MKAGVFVAIYLVTAFLTGGHYFNHRYAGYGDQGLQSIIAGAFWPAYWAGRGSLAITK